MKMIIQIVIYQLNNIKVFTTNKMQEKAKIILKKSFSWVKNNFINWIAPKTSNGSIDRKQQVKNLSEKGIGAISSLSLTGIQKLSDEAIEKLLIEEMM